MAIVGYVRVSSVDQNFQIQIEALQAAGAEKIFSEKQSGTSTDRRVALANCLDWVREGDVLVVTRLDRLARSMTDLRQIIDALEAKRVGFRCIQQPMDTTTAEGRLMLNILGSFAEFETALRYERQMEGIAKAKAAGTYSRKQRRKPKVTKEEIVALREQGLGATEISRKLGVHKTTIYRTVPDGWGAAPIGDENAGSDRAKHAA